MFVEVERWFSVKLVKHIALRARNAALWAEQFPASRTAVADRDRIAIRADRGDTARRGRAVEADIGGPEARAVSRKAPGDNNLVAGASPNSADKLTANDARAVR